MSWSSQTITTPACEFLVRTGGGGESQLIYLHDEQSTCAVPLLDELAANHSVCAPVLPGFGDAERPAWVENVRDVSDCLLDLVDSLQLRRPVIVGSSIGAWAAAELGLRLEGRARGLVLIGPLGLRIPGAAPIDHWFLPEDARPELFFANVAHRPEIEIGEQIANDESAARYGWHPRFADATLEHRARRLRLPSLVMVGGDDRFVPRAHGERWATALEHGRLEVVPDAGHYPGYEQPTEVARAIDAFVAALEPLEEGAYA